MKNFHKKNTILVMSTFPPTECGIATFTSDLVHALKNQFEKSFEIIKCNLSKSHNRFDPSNYRLNPKLKEDYKQTALQINKNDTIKLIHIQHEFGLFGGDYGSYLIGFLEEVFAPVIITFHTVLPNPNPELKTIVLKLISQAKAIQVMTKRSAEILMQDYYINSEKISIIPHGTHAIKWAENSVIKEKYGLTNNNILSTFGLLGPGKNIETALRALPEIISAYPNTLYLIIGKTHPHALVNGVDEYRLSLHLLIEKLNISKNVLFLDHFLELPDLLEILQGTDIYLFTSKDPNQAVSGTFAYAMSCGCPIIATSISHTQESLTPDLGRLIEIDNSNQLAKATLELLGNPQLKNEMSLNAFKNSRATSWENIANLQADLYKKLLNPLIELKYKLPTVNLDHIKHMTNKTGIIQFSKIGHPDITSGYTLDDNARALIVLCKHFAIYNNPKDLKYIKRYLNFIEKCQTKDGSFINYLDSEENIHIKNAHVNLDDSNSRAIWALGTVIYHKQILPEDTYLKAANMLQKSLVWIPGVLSPRSIGFLIKGIYLSKNALTDNQRTDFIVKLARRLVTNYDLNKEKDWAWFEEYMTYANSILPEALLYAFLTTQEITYKNIATASLDFLLTKSFKNGQFKSISNNGWYHKDQKTKEYGEQPIEVGYTIEALELFYKTFRTPKYLALMHTAFSWFLGNNHLKQLIYNPLSGGCHDGLEKYNVNLNQGAESSICYLMARLSMERVAKIQPKTAKFNTAKTHVLKNRHLKQREA